MKKLMKLLSVPVIVAATTVSLFGTVIGAIIFKLLSLVLGLVAICTVWAWIIGDSMAILFTGITLGLCAIMAVGSLLSEEIVSKLQTITRRYKPNNKG